ncbi:MAG: BTAD domain-containing putative transcriptional regulator [Acidimicrobiales bacterium]
MASLTSGALGGQGLVFGVLGPLRVTAGGAELRIGSGIERLVANVLAAGPSEAVSGDEMIDVIYGERPNPSAGSSLRTAIWRLRRSLGPHRDAVRTVSLGHQLDLGVCVTDALAFEQHLVHARRLLTSGQGADALGILEEALALWRGPALADWVAHPRAAPIAVRLEEMRLGASEDHAAALGAAGRLESARVELEAFVARYPAREHAWALLVDSLAGLGRGRDAWRAFDAARHGLAEVGLEPGIELREAADRLSLAAWPVPPKQKAGRAALDAVLQASMSLPLVGRDREADELRSVFAEARAGSARLVLVEGEAGVGKTRLVAELASELRDEARIWFETCDPYLNLPYRPLIDLTRELISGYDATERHRLLSGPLGRMATGGDGELRAGDLDPDLGRYQLYEAMAELLSEAVGGAGLLILDDAHRAPVPTLALIRHLLVARPALPLTVLIAYQSAALAGPAHRPAFAELARLSCSRILHLTGLDAAGAGALVGALGVQGLEVGDLRSLQQATGGNPLYIRALWRHWQGSEGLIGTGPSLDGLLDTQLEALDPPVRRVLEIGSVSGRSFDRRVVAAIALADAGLGLDPAGVSQALSSANEGGLVSQDRTSPNSYAFAHELVADALYRRLGGESRARLHLGTGRALERIVGDTQGGPDALAYHFERAWPLCAASEVSQHLGEAAEGASAQLDFDRAASFYSTAVDLLAQEGDDPVATGELDLRLLMGQAQADAGDIDPSRATFASVARTARRAGSRRHLAAAAIHHATTVGPGSTAAEEAEAVQLLDEACMDPGELAPEFYGRLVALQNQLEPGLAVDRTDAIVDRVRSLGDQALVAALLEQLWWYRTGAEALEVAEELIATGRRIGSARSEAYGLLRRWISLIHLGRARLDDAAAADIAVLVEEARDPELSWTWTQWLANLAICRGEFAKAERLLARVLRIPGLASGASSVMISRTRVLSAHRHQVDYLRMLRGDPWRPSGGPGRPNSWTGDASTSVHGTPCSTWPLVGVTMQWRSWM